MHSVAQHSLVLLCYEFSLNIVIDMNMYDYNSLPTNSAILQTV